VGSIYGWSSPDKDGWKDWREEYCYDTIRYDGQWMMFEEVLLFCLVLFLVRSDGGIEVNSTMLLVFPSVTRAEEILPPLIRRPSCHFSSPFEMVQSYPPKKDKLPLKNKGLTQSGYFPKLITSSFLYLPSHNSLSSCQKSSNAIHPCFPSSQCDFGR